MIKTIDCTVPTEIKIEKDNVLIASFSVENITGAVDTSKINVITNNNQIIFELK